MPVFLFMIMENPQVDGIYVCFEPCHGPELRLLDKHENAFVLPELRTLYDITSLQDCRVKTNMQITKSTVISAVRLKSISTVRLSVGKTVKNENVIEEESVTKSRGTSVLNEIHLSPYTFL